MTELPRARWHKSSHSHTGADCVELAAVSRAVAVRDSKHPGGPRLVFSRREWLAFMESLKHLQEGRPRHMT